MSQEEHQQLETLRQSLLRNLVLLQQQAAQFGPLHVPIHIATQIEDTQREISQIELQYAVLPAVDENLRDETYYEYRIAEDERFAGDLNPLVSSLQQLMNIDPSDMSVQSMLATVRKYQRVQREYAIIGRLRAAGCWQAVQKAFADLAN